MDCPSELNEELFYDQAQWITELSHSEVKTDIQRLSQGQEWNVAYHFALCFITLRFRIREGGLLEWEHFRVCPKHRGIGRKFVEIFLEELKIYRIQKVILQPQNHDVADFWRKMGFQPLEEKDGFREWWFIDL